MPASKPPSSGCEVTWPDTPVDMDKLERAVGRYETGYCTSPGSPTANARNNCHGIMAWPNGVRTLKYFPSTADSGAAFKRIWEKSYGGYPDLAKARKYSGNDRACTWLKTVNTFYLQ